MNAKILAFVICFIYFVLAFVEAIIYLLLHNLHDCIFNTTLDEYNEKYTLEEYMYPNGTSDYSTKYDFE